MHRSYHRWHSHQLGREMELLVFGHGGTPYIVFPTSMGAFFEYEDAGMIDVLGEKLQRGVLQLFCVATVDSESFYGKHLHPRARIDRYLQYERYLMEDVVPFVQRANGQMVSGLTGCSFGAYHALTLALRHPETFTACVTMGGAFALDNFLDGYYDQDAYFLSPPHFLPNLADPWLLDCLRRNKWVLVTGEHDICRRETEFTAGLLAAKDIPHSLHVWGHGSYHDWPEWRKMAAAYLP